MNWLMWHIKKKLIKKVDYQNVPIVIHNIKLYINNLKLFYKFYWVIENIKKIFIKKWII